MNKKHYTWMLLLSLTGFGYAQEQTPTRNCGSYDYYQNMLKNDPDFAAKQVEIEQQTTDYMNSQSAMKMNGQEQTQSILTVPVVFHIVYNTTAQNISDTRINEQIAILNKDFSATNTDINKVPSAFSSLVGNAGIQFCLAKVDPSGNPTTGIIRKSSTTTSWSTNDAVKKASSGGDDIWDHTKYLNIWVCNLSGGILGYSTFPGSAASVDGVVLTYQYVGTTGVSAPYNKGRTGTHEIGHWFNLYHIWGDASCGDDKVSDTPTQQTSNSGCPSFPSVTCSNGPNGDMFMNYMDYSDDPCMNMFSKGQVARMQATFATTTSSRYSLFNSTKCGTQSPTIDAGVSAILSPSGDICGSSITPVVTLSNIGSTTLTSAKIIYTIDGGGSTTYNWSGSLATGATTNVTLPAFSTSSGSHTFAAATSNPNGTTDANTSNDASSLGFVLHGAGITLPFTEGFETSTFPPANWGINNPDALTTWTRATTAKKSGTASAVVKNYNYTNASGDRDELITPGLDLTTQSNPELNFYVAYTYYTTPYQYSDTLEVLVSTDCGATLTSIYRNWGTNLATAPSTTSSFVPTSAQWKKVNVPLSAFASYNNATFYFRNSSEYENNMYIDDININSASATGISEVSSAGISIFPNPSQGDVFINLGNENNEKTVINAYNMLGENVLSQQANTGLVKLDMNGFTPGMYVIEVLANDKRMTKRVLIDK